MDYPAEYSNIYLYTGFDPRTMLTPNIAQGMSLEELEALMFEQRPELQPEYIAQIELDNAEQHLIQLDSDVQGGVQTEVQAEIQFTKYIEPVLAKNNLAITNPWEGAAEAAQEAEALREATEFATTQMLMDFAEESAAVAGGNELDIQRTVDNMVKEYQTASYDKKLEIENLVNQLQSAAPVETDTGLLSKYFALENSVVNKLDIWFADNVPQLAGQGKIIIWAGGIGLLLFILARARKR